jgi:osmotically-inducible protein OsmY
MRAARSPRAVAALCALAATGVALAVLPGCANYRALQQCGYQGCAGDRQISDQVRALLRQHTELLPPNIIYVHTVNGVVYLSGEVATDLQRDTAVAVARQAPGAGEVVDMIALEYQGW